MSAMRPKLRFKVGDKLLASYKNKEMVEVEVTQLPEDTDECVCSIYASPMERLLESIDQRLPLRHIKPLCSKFGIDVSVRPELVLDCARSGHAPALAWLLSENPSAINCLDDKNRNILQIAARSPNAVEIFQAFQNRNGTCFPDDQIEGDEEDDEGEELNASIKLGEWKSEETRFFELLTNIDDDGQSVLHIAVLTAAKKDSGVLKILLEPRVATRFGNGAARIFYSDPVFHDCESPFHQWLTQEANRCPRWPENVPIFDVRDSKGRTARDIAVKFKNGNAVRMLDACVWSARFSTWNVRLERVFIPRGVKDTDIVEHFMELDVEEAIKVIAQGKVLKAEAVQQDLALAGKVADEVLGDRFLWCFPSRVYNKQLFSHVIDVWRLNHSQLRPLRTSNHRNLFEICCTDGNANRVPYCREIVENVDLASQVIGEVEHTYLPNEKLEKRSEFLEYGRQILLERPNYISCLRNFHGFPGWDGTTSLSDVLDKFKDSDDHYDHHYWKQFISQRSLIVSDSDKPGYRTKLRANKLDIIQWLVDERGLKCPSVALCVLEYKTWMLRWIFETGHADFDSKAAENGDIVKCSIGASWFVDGGAHMSVGEWLCGLACHIGALGIVKFLVLEVEVRTDAMYDGMNMLHLAVANGCVEVVRWIVQQEIVPVAAMTSGGLNVCHIAAQREPTLFMCSTAPPVAIPMIKVFLRYGCPEVDIHGHDILWHAVEGGAGGVQDWAKGRLDKARNSTNLRLLARMIQDESYSVQDIRGHINSTLCMESKEMRVHVGLGWANRFCIWKPTLRKFSFLLGPGHEVVGEEAEFQERCKHEFERAFFCPLEHEDGDDDDDDDDDDDEDKEEDKRSAKWDCFRFGPILRSLVRRGDQELTMMVYETLSSHAQEILGVDQIDRPLDCGEFKTYCHAAPRGGIFNLALLKNGDLDKFRIYVDIFTSYMFLESQSAASTLSEHQDGHMADRYRAQAQWFEEHIANHGNIDYEQFRNSMTLMNASEISEIMKPLAQAINQCFIEGASVDVLEGLLSAFISQAERLPGYGLGAIDEKTCVFDTSGRLKPTTWSLTMPLTVHIPAPLGFGAAEHVEETIHSPVVYAAAEGFLHIIQWVIGQGRLACTDVMLFEAFDMAARVGQVPVLKYLASLQSGKVFSLGHLSMVLSTACEHGHFDAVAFLMPIVRSQAGLGGDIQNGWFRNHGMRDRQGKDNDEDFHRPTYNQWHHSSGRLPEPEKDILFAGVCCKGAMEYHGPRERFIRTFKFLLSQDDFYDVNEELSASDLMGKECVLLSGLRDVTRMHMILDSVTIEERKSILQDKFELALEMLRAVVEAGANFSDETVCNNLKGYFFSSWYQSEVFLPFQIRAMKFFAEECEISVQDAQCPERFSSKLPQALVDDFRAEFHRIKSEQMARWKHVGSVAKHASVKALEEEGGCIDFTAKDSFGRTVVHVAASSDRDDIVKWLVLEKGADLGLKDRQGRTAIEMARAAGGTKVVAFIERHAAGVAISTFVSSHWRRMRALQSVRLRRRAIERIQARWRGIIVRKFHRTMLLANVSVRRRFEGIWRPVYSLLGGNDGQLPPASREMSCWQDVKNKMMDITRSFDEAGDEDANDSDQLLEATAQVARAVGDDSVGGVEDDDGHEEEDFGDHAGVGAGVQVDGQVEMAKVTGDGCSDAAFELVSLTEDALKWYKGADGRYADLFVKRITQLASGQRSRILQKHLVGSRHHIYETYLDQASAQRILWTECREEGKATILVWYVSKHKWVSRYIRQIDEAHARLNRQPKSALSLFADSASESGDATAMKLDPDTVLLDPMSNCPLKLHQMRHFEIQRLATREWQPPLRLTGLEREIVERQGTVLLLGRSGTGKTCVIVNRMSHDRQQSTMPLRQLFVARSRRICALVERLQDKVSPGQAFLKQGEAGGPLPGRDGELQGGERTILELDELVRECIRSRTNQDLGGEFVRSRRVDFLRFKADFFRSRTREKLCRRLDAVVVWTQIQSFIQGSVEAVLAKRPLEEDEYLALGESRVRLSREQRLQAYAAYKAYSAWCTDTKLWDDSQRMLRVLANLQVEEEPVYHRIYVDEVQDWTQAELALLFLLGGASTPLFLAGDTAQSVVEGVDFRFSEIRSLAYGLGHVPPDKPLTLQLNFRSHSGILDVAAAVLGCLFSECPGAANKLPSDVGLYKGPRPSLFRVAGLGELKRMLEGNEGLVVLVPDSIAREVQGACGSGATVLGIREAKGLEFAEVAIVNFFDVLTLEQGKAWKLLMKIDEGVEDAAKGDVRRKYPEVEGQLKLLYTAITRAQRRLILVETSRSLAGEALFRWLEGKGIAEACRGFEGLGGSIMSGDEWASRGLDFAIEAEEAGLSLEGHAGAWIARALECFDRAGRADLCRMARSHARCIELLGETSAGALEDSEGTLGLREEEDIARVARACIMDGLLKVALDLCREAMHSSAPRAREMIMSEVVRKLEQQSGSA